MIETPGPLDDAPDIEEILSKESQHLKIKEGLKLIEEHKVSHPEYYNQIPDIECIEVVQHFNFNVGNAIKYLWRHELKESKIKDLEKARMYIDFEIERIKKFDLPET